MELNVSRDLSLLSQDEVNNLLYRTVTCEDALRYMTEELQIRTFSETLHLFYSGDDLRKKLTDGLYGIERALDGSVSRESISRNIRNWLCGQNMPDRENLFRICFALHLSEQAANKFLSFTSEGGFHLRSPRELCLAFGLRTDKTYSEALGLYKKLRPLSEKPGWEKNIAFTKTVADSFADVTDDTSFLQFYEENYDSLGVMHNTAYCKCFMPFINTLICPDVPSFFEKEKKYSVEEVVDQYLRISIPPGKSRANYSLIQGVVRKYWPNTASITRMRNRTEDVSRKILLLLYLVTDGHSSADDGLSETGELSLGERFETHFWKLNAMLNDCGFSLLDPRGIFDWLVLFCLKADGDELMSERLSDLLSRLYSSEMN